MHKYRIMALLCMFIVGFLFSAQMIGAAAGNTLWVSPNGSDTNPGSETQPFQTIQKAADTVVAGDTVMIMPGVYSERVIISHSGTETAPITFQSTQRWGAVMSMNSPWLFKSDKVNDAWSAYYITLRGLVFKDTPEGDDGHGFQNSLLYRAAVMPSKGWRIEDCLFQNTGGGVFARGDEGNVDDIAISRTVFENVKENSIAANGSNFDGQPEYIMQNFSLTDSIIRRGNQAGHDPGGTTGAQKILLSNKTQIQNLTSYDNVGTGVWFDYQNVDFTVNNSSVFGNHGLTDDWQGTGIWSEVNPSGVISNNLVYSNTGSGIGVLESQNVTVQNNLIVDVLDGIEFRNIAGRRYALLDDVIQGNSFAPRKNGTGVSAGAGDFTGIDVQKIVNNIYDPSVNPWVNWAGQTCTDGADCQTAALETGGISQTVSLPAGFHVIPVYTTKDPAQFQQVDISSEALTIDSAIADHAVGSSAQIPVFRRDDIQGSGPWTVNVFDLQSRALTLTLSDEAAKKQIEASIPIYMMLMPTYLNVSLTRVDPYDFEATFTNMDVSTATAEATDQAQGSLLGYWKFDEGTGAAAIDSSPNRNDAVLVDGAWAAGKFGKGAQFDGTSAYVNVGNHANLSVGAGDFTSTLWLNLSSDPTSDFRGVMGYGDDVDGWLWGPIPKNNVISVQLHDKKTVNQMSLEFPAVLTPGQWYYVAVEKHNDQYQVFVNGEPAGDPQTGYADVSNDSGHLYMGYVPWWSGGFFLGVLDEARLYSEALPADALASLMKG